MSYEIVKRIRIVNNEVLITSASNNVSPRTYDEENSKFFTKMLNNEGLDAFNLEILKLYEGGSFQKGTPNKWSNAIEKVKSLDVYQNYNWRLSTYNKDCPIQKARNSKEFDDLLLSGFKIKNEKYIINCNQNLFVTKLTKKKYSFTTDKSKAKIFKIFKDAENIKNRMLYIDAKVVKL